MRPDRGTLLIVAAGLLLMAPALVLGTPPNQGIHFDITWALDFGDQLRAGQIYPRWLPGSFGGLGTPVFWFYAPLPFFAIGAVDLLAGGALAPEWTIAIAMAALRILAGIGMRAWLTRLASPPVALAGAVLYMAAPYHLLDFYLRGSLGELAMFAVLPFLALATAALPAAGSRPVAGFALATALVILSHLTVGFSVGLLLMLPQFLFVAWRSGGRWRVLLRGAAGGLLGLGLAAFYAVPAVLLLPIVGIDRMFDASYAATNWLLAHPARWPSPDLVVFVASVVLAGTVLALGIVVLARAPAAREARFWAWLVIALAVLLVGVPDWPWRPWSPLSKLQFPWRMLTVLEFAAVSCLAAAWRHVATRAIQRLSAVALAAAMPAAIMLCAIAVLAFAHGQGEEWRRNRDRFVEMRLGLLEYLPPGHRFGADRPENVSVEEVQAMLRAHAGRGEAWSDTAEVTVSDIDRSTGAMRLAVRAPEEALVVLHRFHYPLWRLEQADGAPGPPLTPHGDDLLMSFRVPPGSAEFRLVPVTPPSATAAGALSLGSLVLVALLAWRRPARRRAALAGAAHPLSGGDGAGNRRTERRGRRPHQDL